jgi:hypothetical protein
MKKKLIEVSLPLKTINEASVRESDIYYRGNPLLLYKMVGVATAGCCAVGDLRADGGRSVGASRQILGR